MVLNLAAGSPDSPLGGNGGSHDAPDDCHVGGCRFARSRNDRLWSHSHASLTGRSARSAGMMSLHDMHTAAGVDKLTVQEIEDLSLGRVQLTNGDRWFFVLLYRWFPSILHIAGSFLRSQRTRPAP